MIKQLTIRNLYNYEQEITLDMTPSKEMRSFYKNDQAVIFYFALTDVSSDLQSAVRESIDYILSGGNTEPSSNNDTSLFELLVENEGNEIRYGFEIDSDDGVVVDEWILSKSKLSRKETMLFQRCEQTVNEKHFDAPERKIISEVESNSLLLTEFLNADVQNRIVSELIDSIKRVVFISQSSETDSSTIAKSIRLINENDMKKNTLESFISNVDLRVNELNKQEDASQSSIQLENTQDYSVEFVDNNDRSYKYEELPTGTKRLVMIVTTILSKLNKDYTFFIDEIEGGLQPDQVELLLSFIELITTMSPNNQFIITTNRDVQYLSNQSRSKSYRLDAFDTNLMQDHDFDLMKLLEALNEERDEAHLVQVKKKKKQWLN